MTHAEKVAAIILSALKGTGAYAATAGSVVEKEATITGGAFGDVHALVDSLTGDASPDRATNTITATTRTTTLSDWETTLGLAGIGTTAQRQAAILAKLAYFATPTVQEIKDAMEVLLGYEPHVHEVKAATLAGTGREDQVFVFAVECTAGYPAPSVVTAMEQVLDRIKQTHTDYRICERVGFRCDDPDSLCDRDLLAT